MTKQVRYLAPTPSFIVGSSFFSFYFCFFTPHVREIMHAMAFAYFFNFYTQYCYFLFLRLCGYIRNLEFCVFVYMKIFIRLMDLKR